jgi:hypothetical protein
MIGLPEITLEFYCTDQGTATPNKLASICQSVIFILARSTAISLQDMQIRH